MFVSMKITWVGLMKLSSYLVRHGKKGIEILAEKCSFCSVKNDETKKTFYLPGFFVVFSDIFFAN